MLSTEHPQFAHNLQSGTPTLDGLAGSGIAVLDAVLVTGWGAQTATGTVSAGVLTLTTPSAHPFELHQMALVQGATDPLLNGRHRVTARTTNTLSVSVPGAADGPAGGALNVRVAPAGWNKVFSGTNKAAYRSSNVTGTGLFLRVDDTSGQSMRVVGYETMSDVDTGEGPFPATSQLSGGGWWPKSNASSSAPRGWTVVADDRTLYLHTHTSADTGANGSVWAFGDVMSYMPVDPYGAVLFSAPSNVVTSQGSTLYTLEFCPSSSAVQAYAARASSAVGGSSGITHIAESYRNTDNLSGAGYGLVTTYPNPANNGLTLSRKCVLESSPLNMRGVLPGLYVAPQNCHNSFNRGDRVAGQGDVAGRTLLAVKCGSPASLVSQAVVFFDITGPWA